MMLGAISPFTYIWIAILIVLIYFLLRSFYFWLQRKSLAKLGGPLSEKQFESTMRKAQLIDLREKSEFDHGHILGARNIPYSQFQYSYQGLRKDLPVYLYDSSVSLSTRAAIKLRKAGYQHIYWLKDGYLNWKGKTKKKSN